MSSNPFLVTKVDTLKEAFPTIENSVIENTLWLENGDMEKTFERLLAMTDPSAAIHAPPPAPRTTPAATTTNTNPRIRPPNLPSQQRPLPSAPAKPSFQTVREELSQWRQELANDRDLRRTNRGSHRRSQPHSGLRSSAASNYELQSPYRDLYSLTDVVNEGRAAALKAATSLYDRFVTANSVYGNPMLSSSSSSASSSSTSPAASYAYHQSNNTAPNLYSRSSATISSTSRSYSNHRNNPSSIASSSSSISRNRPLPQPPQPTQQNHVARNPFDSNDHAEALPPPTYEAREHDTLIDPMEADRILLHTSSHTS